MSTTGAGADDNGKNISVYKLTPSRIGTISICVGSLGDNCFSGGGAKRAFSQAAKRVS
jgi:hypothetical protein